MKQNKTTTIKKSTFDKIKNKFNELILLSTLQGWPNLIRSQRPFFKFIWFASLIASASLCVYYEIRTILDYFNYEIVTKITSLNEVNPEFPTFSLCNEKNKTFEINFLFFFFNFFVFKDQWKNYFEAYNDTVYGKCYRFNSGLNYNGTKTEILRSGSAGKLNGLNIGLYIENDYPMSNLFIFFHNHTFKPATIFSRTHHLVMGANYQFTIERIFNENLEEPYNDCLKDINNFKKNKTIVNYFIQKQQMYSQEECFRYCDNFYFNETNKCNCSLDTLDHNIYIECLDKHRNTPISDCAEKFLQNFSKNPFELCAEYCPLECDSITYNINSNSQAFPTIGNISGGQIEWKNLKEFKTFENVSKSYIGLSVFYNKLKYTYISQQPKMRVFDLISNIGGLFGLFLGMGLLSVIELLEIFLEIIFVLIIKK